MIGRRTVCLLLGATPFAAIGQETKMPRQPKIARIWRGRTRREIADQYEA